MKDLTLLFLMNEATTDAEVSEQAARAVARNARLICLVLSKLPAFPISVYSTAPYGGIDIPTDWLDQMNESRAELKARCDALESVLQDAGASGDVQAVFSVSSDMRAAVARRALVCDIATVAKNLRDDDAVFQAAAYSILFDSPIPLLLNTPLPVRAERVLVAWNTERPAAQAIHAALPLLKEAAEVVIASFDPQASEYRDGEDPGADLARWLSHHGCSVTVNQYPSGGVPVAEAIQRRATEIGADLVVMGAFGRSRLQQLVFGGTTRFMLDQTEIAVLMAH